DLWHFSYRTQVCSPCPCCSTACCWRQPPRLRRDAGRLSHGAAYGSWCQMRFSRSASLYQRQCLTGRAEWSCLPTRSGRDCLRGESSQRCATESSVTESSAPEKSVTESSVTGLVEEFEKLRRP